MPCSPTGWPVIILPLSWPSWDKYSHHISNRHFSAPVPSHIGSTPGDKPTRECSCLLCHFSGSKNFKKKTFRWKRMFFLSWRATCDRLGSERSLLVRPLCHFAPCRPLLLLILHFGAIPLLLFLPLPLLFGASFLGFLEDLSGVFCALRIWTGEKVSLWLRQAKIFGEKVGKVPLRLAWYSSYSFSFAAFGCCAPPPAAGLSLVSKHIGVGRCKYRTRHLKVHVYEAHLHTLPSLDRGFNDKPLRIRAKMPYKEVCCTVFMCAPNQCLLWQLFLYLVFCNWFLS